MIGKTVSHYKIIEKLGGGGMGIVYKAQDLKLDRFVALKFLPPHLTTSEEEKQRFIHEAKAASSLDHNNICAIHEIDETEDSKLFISMAYYEGETLNKRIIEKPLPLDGAIDIAIQIAQGLTKAHEKDIVHRDIKPANIMLTKESVVKVLDFGLAKLATQTKLTKDGTTLGTIAYMSPEQARGDLVDHRTDIWSFGVILYEMISGKLPFRGDYDQAVIYGIVNEQPEPITGLRTGVPLELERIVNRCISKDAQDRYQHADDLLSELNKVKKESDLRAISTQTAALKNRFKSFLLPTAIVFIVILIILAYLLVPLGEKRASGWENSIAVLPFADLSPEKDQEYFCDGMTEQIITNLSKIKRLKVIARTSVMTYKNITKQIPEIGKELNVAYILEGSMRKYGNSIRVTAQLINTEDGSHLWADDFDRKLEHVFEVQDDVSQAIASNLLATLSSEEKEHIKTNRPSNTEAYEYYMKGRYFYLNSYNYSGSIKMEDFIASEKMLKTAIKLDPDFADSYASLADLYNACFYHLARTNEEKDKYMRLQEAYIDTAFQLNPNSSEVYYVKGWVHSSKKENADAIVSEKKALRINRNNDGAYHALGRMMRFRGLNKLSIKCYSNAIEINPLAPLYYVHRAEGYRKTGEYDKAEIDLQKALEMESDTRLTIIEYSTLMIEIKKPNRAKRMIDKISKLYPDAEINDMFEAALFALNGEKEKALRVNLSDTWHKLYIYLLLEMSDESIQALNDDFNRIKNTQGSWYLPMKHCIIYNFLRPDPHFQEILAKHKELYEENLAKYGDIDI
jgi:non-specific serine/threonine protein kinase